MKKRNSERTYHRSIIRILAAALAMLLVLNTAEYAYAKEALIPQISGYPLPLSDGASQDLSDDTTRVTAKGFEIPGDKCLTGLTLKDLDEPVPGEPFDKTATITSKEGETWDIPVFWIDGDGKAVDVPEEGKSYMPLLVFFVPDGFTGDGFLTLPSFLSKLFLGTGGVLTIVDYDRGITYITGNGAELSQMSSAYAGDSEEGGRPENTGGGGEPFQPANTDDGQPGGKPEKRDNEPSSKPEKPDNEPKNPDDTQPGDTPENPDDAPEEPDLYATFAEKYREDKYKRVAWAEELEAMGGMENVDFVRLIRECGYNATTGIDLYARDAFEDPERSNELMMALNSARKAVAKEIVDQADPYLKAHVDENIILKSNQESLLAFVHTLIDNIIPQAVRVLRENIPAFAKAPDEAFSRNLGFDIISGKANLGGVSGSYEQTENFQFILRVYAENFTAGKDEKGGYTFDLDNDSLSLNRLKDTMLHEMMHVFMYDYNRNGMDYFLKIAGTEDGLYPVPGFGDLTKDQLSDLRNTLQYPNWFAEGIASLCGCVFLNYASYYSNMKLPDDEGSYSAAGIYDYIMKKNITLDGTGYDSTGSFYSDYLFGSLAVLYMGEMYARKTSGESAVRPGENGEKTIDTMSIRNGISDILERMHDGETMDSIFADISDGRYRDTREFCENCFKSDGTNEDILTFMADMLNYVDSLNDANGSPAAASILRPYTEDIYDLIDETKSEETDIYVIRDGRAYEISTASAEITTKTGGKSDPSLTLTSSEDEDVSGKEMGSENQLSFENTGSEEGEEPDTDEQTDDASGQEVSEPGSQDETEQWTDSSEAGDVETGESCEADAGEYEEYCEESSEADAA